MKASKQHTVSFTLHGLAVSSGIAIGQAHLISQATLEVSHRVLASRLIDKEVARFEAALSGVRSELDAMRATLEKSPADMRAFIDLHRMILDDPELSEVPKQIIRDRRCNAEWAIVQQMEHLVEQFENGRQRVSAGDILVAAHGSREAARGKRVPSIFSGNSQWLDYIEHDEAGYGIKLE